MMMMLALEFNSTFVIVTEELIHTREKKHKTEYIENGYEKERSDHVFTDIVCNYMNASKLDDNRNNSNRLGFAYVIIFKYLFDNCKMLTDRFITDLFKIGELLDNQL